MTADSKPTAHDPGNAASPPERATISRRRFLQAGASGVATAGSG
ncbi:twin-arginine translocation signal domain-containing protein, partial [Burkholderia sp. Tr-860]